MKVHRGQTLDELAAMPGTEHKSEQQKRKEKKKELNNVMTNI